jgi:hypothetical protein
MLAQQGGDPASLNSLAMVARLLGELGGNGHTAGVDLLDSVHRLLSPPT